MSAILVYAQEIRGATISPHLYLKCRAVSRVAQFANERWLRFAALLQPDEQTRNRVGDWGLRPVLISQECPIRLRPVMPRPPHRDHRRRHGYARRAPRGHITPIHDPHFLSRPCDGLI